MKAKTLTEYLSMIENSPVAYLNGYRAMSVPALHKCKVCGNEWFTLPYRVAKGNGCRKCRDAAFALERRLPLEQYR